MTQHPYKNLPDFCYWAKSVSSFPPGLIDPMTNNYHILKDDKISSMGSCFAQNIALNLKKSGLNYYITELPPSSLTEKEALAENYTIYTARYGNIYTVRQALQLFNRAFNKFNPKHYWRLGVGYIDPFRPLISKNSFNSVDELFTEQEKHLICVKKMFEETDWMVFTLGMTEAWQHADDGAVFPIAPSVHGGDYSDSSCNFINFKYEEVYKDLTKFILSAREINPKIKFILSVSPVALVATYENQHVLMSNTYSKSVLRIAAETVSKEVPNVIYFPAFEIITSSFSRGRYLDANLRTVNQLGINHVMNIFHKHFLGGTSKKKIFLGSNQAEEIICDEDFIIKSINNLKL